MGKSMSVRAKVRIVSFVSAAFLALLATAASGSVRSGRYRRSVLLAQQRALTELDTHISGIGTSLQKGIYANTPPMLESLATELSRQATGAKSSLAALPLADTNLENTYKFLSQVGAFVLTLNKKIARGQKITAEEHEQLAVLLRFAKQLSEQVADMRQNMLCGNFSFETAERALNAGNETAGNLAADMEDAEQAFEDYPTLIYDGPFSDHISQRKPRLLEGAGEISQEKARQKAAAFLGAAPEKLTLMSEETDNTAAYSFAFEKKTIAVTKKGGYFLHMLNAAYPGEAVFSYEEALKTAQDFLRENGYDSMKESYYATIDGVCIINFAYAQEGVTCYPDLIKVGVDLETGEIFSFDGRGYVMNHRRRDLKAPKLSRREAQDSVSPALTVLSSGLALIPTDSRDERLCYEFHCRDGSGAEALVYIDAETGFEDDILLLLYSDGGVLTK